MHLDYRYVKATILVIFFDIPKYVFWVEGAYALGGQIKFPTLS
jgi:hypothetical protein